MEAGRRLSYKKRGGSIAEIPNLEKTKAKLHDNIDARLHDGVQDSHSKISNSNRAAMHSIEPVKRNEKEGWLMHPADSVNITRDIHTAQKRKYCSSKADEDYEEAIFRSQSIPVPPLSH